MKHLRSNRYRVPHIRDPETGKLYPVIAGGADDDVEALLARMGSETDPLSDDELDELEEDLLDEFDEADGDDPDVERMKEVKGQIDAVRAERSRREQERAEKREEAEQLRQEVHPDDPDDEGDPEASDNPDDDEDVDPADEVDDDEGDDPDEVPDNVTDLPDPDVDPDEEPADETDPDADPESVAADGKKGKRPSRKGAARRTPASHRPRPKKKNSRLSIVASGDIPGFSAGSRLDSLEDVGEAFARKADAVMVPSARPGKIPVASFRIDYPDERYLTASAGARSNGEKIERVVGPEAMTASGGFCAPFEISYDLRVSASDRRPITQALPRFGADRGGVSLPTDPVLSDLGADAVSLWTNETDAEPGDSTKPCQRIECGTWTDFDVDALLKCLEVGNFEKRTFPENFEAFWELAGAAHARLAEQTLYDAMVAQSTAVSVGEVLGTYRAVLAGLYRAVAIYRARHRTVENATLRWIAPEWLLNNMAVDRLRQLPGDDVSLAKQSIISDIQAAGVEPIFSPDIEIDPFVDTQGDGPLIGWPTDVETLLYPEGRFLFLDSGTLDFGMEIRDSELNKTNDVQAFLETFEGLADRGGVESLALTFDICPDGSTAATVDTSAACASGS